MKKKSDNNNDKVNNNNVEGERVVSTRDVRSVSSPALCSPAPRAAMLAVARGTAPNSLPDWSIWSRDRDPVVGVIALAHTRSARYVATLYGLSHTRQSHSPTQARVPTRTENQHSHTREAGSVYGNTDTDFEKSERRLCGCAQECGGLPHNQRRSNFVEDWSRVLRVESRAGTRLKLDRS